VYDEGNELLDEVHSKTKSCGGEWEIQCDAIMWLCSSALATKPDSSV